MWKYEQKSGAIIRPDGTLLAIGYSGRVPDGKNDPDKQCDKGVGPIPRGWYTIQAPMSNATKPFYLPLKPNAGTDTCGRSAFQIHGDNKASQASTGCIVVSPKALRQKIWDSDDRLLRVVRNSGDVSALKLSRARITRFLGQ